MRPPAPRVARRRRHTLVYIPLFILGAALFHAAAPVLNGPALAGAVIMIVGAFGVVLESGATHD